jgi:hypothetical protein
MNCRHNSYLPGIALYLDLAIGPLQSDAPTSSRVTRWERVGANLVNVVASERARADRGLDRLDLVHVDDGLVSVMADAVHAVFAWRKILRCAGSRCSASLVTPSTG